MRFGEAVGPGLVFLLTFVEGIAFNGVLLLWCELNELFRVNTSQQEKPQDL